MVQRCRRGGTGGVEGEGGAGGEAGARFRCGEGGEEGGGGERWGGVDKDAYDKSRDCGGQGMGKELPIWRLAFFSRLEERKGIKLFVDAVSQIKAPDMDKFEVR